MHILAVFDNQLIRILDCDQLIQFSHSLKNLKMITNFYEQVIILNLNTEERRPDSIMFQPKKIENWILNSIFNFLILKIECMCHYSIFNSPKKIENWKLNADSIFNFLNLTWSLISVWKLNIISIVWWSIPCTFIVYSHAGNLWLHPLLWQHIGYMVHDQAFQLKYSNVTNTKCVANLLCRQLF